MIWKRPKGSFLSDCCCRHVGYSKPLLREPGEFALSAISRRHNSSRSAAGVRPRHASLSAFAGLSVPKWVQEQAPKSVPESLGRDTRLDPGEMAAIALALELKADAVLIDETDGRQAARRHGLATIGVLGVLVRARLREVLLWWGLVPRRRFRTGTGLTNEAAA